MSDEITNENLLDTWASRLIGVLVNEIIYTQCRADIDQLVAAIGHIRRVHRDDLDEAKHFDGTYVGDDPGGVPYCGDQGGAQGFTCMRPPEHSGTHEAYENNDSTQPCHQWSGAQTIKGAGDN